MSPDNIQNIIEFAIAREQEAIDFYTELARKVKIEAVAEELKKLAQMEMGHKAKLQSVDVYAFAQSKPAGVSDLKIADYVVPSAPTADMKWPDIINIAMHRELASVQLYKDLASRVADPALKRLFENLAAEEQKHKLYLETIWDEDVMKEN